MRPGKLIHYGTPKFSIKKWEKVTNAQWIKPKGGLWTCPLDSKHSWKQWCEAENFRDCSENNAFIVELKEDAKIFIVNSPDDLKKMPSVVDRLAETYKELPPRFIPDFEKIAESYDAIWLTEVGEITTRYGYGATFDSRYSFYGWDCETVLILNENAIKL